MCESSKQYEVLNWAFSFLQKNNREERVAEILLQHLLGMSRSEYFANMQENIGDSIIKQFKADIHKHVMTGVPVQHITGYEEFFGREFEVNQHVLIPRFETEELVQHVIHIVEKNLAENQPVTIVDVGTGSGIIGITLALELANATVYATDISTQALQVAKRNAKKHGANIQFVQGNFLEGITEYCNPHVIVSNPPYIAETERDFLSDTVKNFDPDLALFASNNGLAAYQEIIGQIASLSDRSERYICFEIGYTQSSAVTTILEQKLSPKQIKTIKDLNGKDRIISAQL